jgi:NlpE N-terminal domain
MRASASRPLQSRPRLPRSLLALCWLIAAACPAAQVLKSANTLASLHPAGFWRQEADPSGTYQGNAPATDASRRVFTLNLASDGTAILTTLYIGKNDATEHGRWTQNGSQIVLTFDPIGPNRPPRPITFRHRDHELSPIHWDPSEWGRTGPPTLHRARSKSTSAAILPDPPAAFLKTALGGL